MPQKRNPDVFELMRGRSAVAHAALNEVLEHHAKTDLGLSPRFAADQAAVVPRHRFLPADAGQFCRAPSTACASGRRISGSIPSIHAAAAANALVAKEGIPFREAYRRVAAKLKDSE